MDEAGWAGWDERAVARRLRLLVNNQQVDGINYRTVANGWRFVYGPTPDKIISNQVEKFADAARKIRTDEPET
jgi:hypothetical protein